MKNAVRIIWSMLIVLSANPVFGQHTELLKKKYVINVTVANGKPTADSAVASIVEFDKNAKETSHAFLNDKAEVESMYKILYQDTTPVSKEYFELKNGRLESVGKTEYKIIYNTDGKKEKEERTTEVGSSTVITYAYNKKGLLVSETEQQNKKEKSTVLIYQYTYDNENRTLSRDLISPLNKDSIVKNKCIVYLSGSEVWKRGKLIQVKYETIGLSQKPDTDVTTIEYSGNQVIKKTIYNNDLLRHKTTFKYIGNSYISTDYSYENNVITGHSIAEYKKNHIIKIETYDKDGQLISLQVYKYDFY